MEVLGEALAILPKAFGRVAMDSPFGFAGVVLPEHDAGQGERGLKFLAGYRAVFFSGGHFLVGF